MNCHNKYQSMNTSSLVAYFIAGIFILAVGVYLSVKIISASFKEKSNTWKLDISNSIVVIAHHAHCLLMEFMTYYVPDLYIHTGQWFCYSSKVVTHYFNIYVTQFSLITGIMKYVIILHWRKVLEIGDEKVKNVFFVVNLFHPVLQIILWLMIEPNFFYESDSHARIDRCLGDPKNNWGPDDLPTNRTQNKLHVICNNLLNRPLDDYFEYTVQYGRSILCWTQFIFLYFSFWNILDVMVYLRIFIFMRR